MAAKVYVALMMAPADDARLKDMAWQRRVSKSELMRRLIHLGLRFEQECGQQ